jgi:hypothetical protein
VPPVFDKQYLSYNDLLLVQRQLGLICQLGRQLGLWLPAWTPAWTTVSSWTVESYTSIPPHLHSKSLPRFFTYFWRVAPPDCLYKRRACSRKAGSEERERWATQLSRTPSKASARDAEQHSHLSGSSLVALAKLELP